MVMEGRKKTYVGEDDSSLSFLSVVGYSLNLAFNRGLCCSN